MFLEVESKFEAKIFKSLISLQASKIYGLNSSEYFISKRGELFTRRGYKNSAA